MNTLKEYLMRHIFNVLVEKKQRISGIGLDRMPGSMVPGLILLLSTLEGWECPPGIEGEIIINN